MLRRAQAWTPKGRADNEAAPSQQTNERASGPNALINRRSRRARARGKTRKRASSRRALRSYRPIMPSDGYNWFLILVAIIASVVLVAINVYVLIHFQHPEDRNQAWFPKLVVVRT